MDETKRRMLELLKNKSFKQGEFTLASGKKSDFFIDCKEVTLMAQGLLYSGLIFFDFIKRWYLCGSYKVDYLVGVPLGGCTIVDATAFVCSLNKIDMNILYIRDTKKNHGTKQRIEGLKSIHKGNKVILIEDVVTTGGSSINAIRVLHDAGLKVECVLTLIDRLEGGSENIKNKTGVYLYSIFTRNNFIKEIDSKNEVIK